MFKASQLAIDPACMMHATALRTSRLFSAEVGEVVMTLQSVVGEELDLPETSEDLTQPLNR